MTPSQPEDPLDGNGSCRRKVKVANGNGVWTWQIIIALKALSQAKTRLKIPPDYRSEIALAMALDTALVARRSPVVANVMLVCTDPRVRATCATYGIKVLTEEPTGGINAALRYAGAIIQCSHPDHAIALMTGDLPAFDSGELTLALRATAAIGESTVLADTTGSGTTMLTVPPGGSIYPLFGPDSFLHHFHSGARPLRLARNSGLRNDVDTMDDLSRARTIGVGGFTQKFLDARLSEMTLSEMTLN